MSKKTQRSSVLNGALQGGTAGAVGGSAFGPWGAAIGGAGGALLGGVGGYFADQADEADPEYQDAMRKERAKKMFSASLGRAFGAMGKGMGANTYAGALNRGY